MVDERASMTSMGLNMAQGTPGQYARASMGIPGQYGRMGMESMVVQHPPALTPQWTQKLKRCVDTSALVVSDQHTRKLKSCVDTSPLHPRTGATLVASTLRVFMFS